MPSMKNTTLRKAKRLRQSMTEAEHVLWQALRAKRFNHFKFYRQKPMGPYIVDFYNHAYQLVIEVDGSQHITAQGIANDAVRTAYLNGLGLTVIRFDNRQILTELNGVLAVIAEHFVEPLPPL
jgi:very-short-patch-repair endonuclease